MATQNSLQLGIECLKAGKIDEAVEHLERATAESPQDYQGFNYLGVAYSLKRQYNRAVGAFQAALRLRPNVPSIHYNLGLAYQADGLPDLAREQFEHALKIDPAYKKAADALAALNKQLAKDDYSEMACARHTDEPAVGVCSFCHLPVCNQCKRIRGGQVYCVSCIEKLEG
jgi:tetratricopeptide (TPR) repeat protein